MGCLFCKHKWKTIERDVIEVKYGDNGMFHKYVTRQQCDKCGKEVIRIKGTR